MFAYMLKRGEVMERYRKLQNKELHNFFFIRHYLDIKQDENMK
jgi:hypothetical protein